MATVWATGAVQHRAKRQHVVLAGRLNFARSSLHASLQHADFDGEISQALETNVLVTDSRIWHGGRTIRLAADGCKGG